MTNLAPIDYTELVDVNLVAKDRVIKGVLILLNEIVDVLLWQHIDVVLEILIALLRQLTRLFQQISFFTERLAPPRTGVVDSSLLWRVCDVIYGELVASV